MDKKKIIQIVVIVIAFGGSGVVLYNGFFKSSASPVQPAAAVPSTVAVSGAAAGAANPLLPYGSSFDVGGVLKKQPLQFDAVTYPTINTTTDVGIYDDATQSYTQPLLK